MTEESTLYRPTSTVSVLPKLDLGSSSSREYVFKAEAARMKSSLHIPPCIPWRGFSLDETVSEEVNLLIRYV